MKNNSQTLIKLINDIKGNKTYPATKVVDDNQNYAAIMSKLVKSNRPDKDANVFDKKSIYAVNNGSFQNISENIKSRINDSENTLALFPDIELAIQILTSSILSPKDMVNTTLLYRTKEQVLPSAVTAKLNTYVKGVLENEFELIKILNPSLRDMLFNTGSYIKAVIPESAVDEIINGKMTVSTEAMQESLRTLFNPNMETVHLGLLGNSKSNSKNIGLESFFTHNKTSNYNPRISLEDSDIDIKISDKLKDLYEVVDNYNVLKMPDVIKVINEKKVSKIVKNKIGLENFTNQSVSGLLYKPGSSGVDEMVYVNTAKSAQRKTVGKPLVLNLPSESVIPVHIPGNEESHIGYFVLVDEDGNPVSYKTDSSSMNNMQGNLQGAINNSAGANNQLSSMLLTKAKKNLTDTSAAPTIDNISSIYNSIIENDLKNRLKNGAYNNNFTIADSNEIFRIMLARALSNKFTRLVFIPKELVTYFAFKYLPNGVGKSYLDDLKVLTSLRAMLLFSKVMAKVKNSINITTVNMTLDPNDPDPLKTVEIAKHDIARVREQSFPLGLNSPKDLTDWISRAGMEFTFEGHPGLPQTKLNFDTRSIQHIEPDTELDENLRKQTYMSMGLSPEVVDNGFGSEFAATVVTNNALMSKRISLLQQTYTGFLSDYSRKLLINDADSVSEIKKIIIENESLIIKTISEEEKEILSESKEKFYCYMVDKYIRNLCIELPKPDSSTIESQITSFDQYVDALDKAIPAFINSEFMTSELVGEISGNIDSITSVVKQYFIRKWLADNGFLNELSDIVTSDDDESKPILDIYEINKTHMQAIIKSCGKLIEKMLPIKKNSDKKLEDINNGISDDSFSSDTSSDTTSDSSDFTDNETEDPLLDDSFDDTISEDTDFDI